LRAITSSIVSSLAGPAASVHDGFAPARDHRSLDIDDEQRRMPDRHRVAADERQPVARAQPCRPDGRLGKRLRRVEQLPVPPGPPLAEQRQADLGEGGEIAGAERAELARERCQPGIERLWRQELEGRGVFILGEALGGPETATTLRFRDGEMPLPAET
jgi:hypothetical protein